MNNNERVWCRWWLSSLSNLSWIAVGMKLNSNSINEGRDTPGSVIVFVLLASVLALVLRMYSNRLRSEHAHD